MPKQCYVQNGLGDIDKSFCNLSSKRFVLPSSVSRICTNSQKYAPAGYFAQVATAADGLSRGAIVQSHLCATRVFPENVRELFMSFITKEMRDFEGISNTHIFSTPP